MRKPKSLCSYPGCNALTRERRCEAHQAPQKTHVSRAAKQRAAARESAHKRGYTHTWRKAAKGFLNRHPLCVHCEQQGRAVSAAEVDHIKPHRGDEDLFWDRNNWQPLCKRCHSRKTAREDGGFGHATRT